MLLIRITALSVLLTLAACSSSNDAPPSTDATNNNNTTSNTNDPADGTLTPSNDQPGTGSITLDTSSTITLEALPEVTDTANSDGKPVFNGDGTTSPATTEGTESIDAGGIVGAGASPSGAMDDASSVTDAGFGGTGVSDVGSVDASAGAVASDSVRPPSISLPEPFNPEPEFQSGSLTAADYDDQLNPHLYQTYASDYLQRVGGKLDVP